MLILFKKPRETFAKKKNIITYPESSKFDRWPNLYLLENKMLQRVLAKYKIQIQVIFFLNQSNSVIGQILKDRIYGVTVHFFEPGC